MSDSVLSAVALSCEAVPNRSREAQAYVLRVRSLPAGHADGAHLARVLRESHLPQAITLAIHPDTPALACGLLQAADALPGPLVVDHAWLGDAPLQAALQATRAEERPVLLRAAPGATLPPPLQRRFVRRLVAPDLRQTVALMAQATAVTAQGERGAVRPAAGPIAQSLAGQWVEGIASARLSSWCLDAAGAAGVVGWPVDEALMSARTHPGAALPVDLRIVRSLLIDIDQDRALESLNGRMCSDPVLAYRFLRFVNSAGLGLRSEVETVRSGLMMVGSHNLRQWLYEVQPRASDDANLRPLRAMSVMCSRLMALLVDAGNQAQLSEELALCGLFSELEPLAGEPIAELLAPLPLPARVRDAVLHERGPYGPYLAVARALLGRTPSVAASCAAHEVPLDEANRALLRALATQPALRRLSAAAVA